MEFKPLPITRHRMISGSRPSVIIVVRHYGSQILAKVSLWLSRKYKKFKKDWWTWATIFGIVGSVSMLVGFAYTDAKATVMAGAKKEARAQKEKQRTIAANSTLARKYLNEWSKAYLGALVSTCSEMYEKDAPYHYTVSCFIGVKDTVPTKA